MVPAISSISCDRTNAHVNGTIFVYGHLLCLSIYDGGFMVTEVH